MRLFNYSRKIFVESPIFPKECSRGDEQFILCRTHEVPKLSTIFGFDESTVLDCSDLDESIRYTNFDGYDFVSIVHIELSESAFLLREINLYISSSFLVLVMPEHDSPRLRQFERKLLDFAKASEEKPEKINMLYFSVFHNLLTDFSYTFETLEDNMQALSEKIVSEVDTHHFTQINELRNMTYTAKKQLRAFSYLGDQILLDENKLLSKNHTRYFRNLSTRLKKLYDFSESLYNLSSEMFRTYDSRLTMKTNDTVNKLTAFTLFFGPLTLITGIYGMNFDFMPELHWPLGYPMALAMMALVILVLFIVLKKKNWL